MSKCIWIFKRYRSKALINDGNTIISAIKANTIVSELSVPKDFIDCTLLKLIIKNPRDRARPVKNIAFPVNSNAIFIL